MDLMVTTLIFMTGLLLGSLLNVIIIRLPREKRLLGWPRCTRTGEPLAWWQLLPIVGWTAQRGRTHDGQRLHWVYPVIELLTGVVLALLYINYAFTPLFFYLVFVCAVLIVTGAIDWLYHSIYTFVILGAALLLLLLNPVVPSISFRDAGLGALAGGISFALLFALAKVIFPGKAAPFGLGDVYLAVFIGAAFGLTRLVETLFYGMVFAGIVAFGIVAAKRLLNRSDMPEYIAYGTYLCLGAIAYVIIQGF